MLIKKALFNEQSKKLHNFSRRLQERRGGILGSVTEDIITNDIITKCRKALE